MNQQEFLNKLQTLLIEYKVNLVPTIQIMEMPTEESAETLDEAVEEVTTNNE